MHRLVSFDCTRAYSDGNLTAFHFVFAQQTRIGRPGLVQITKSMDCFRRGDHRVEDRKVASR